MELIHVQVNGIKISALIFVKHLGTVAVNCSNQRRAQEEINNCFPRKVWTVCANNSWGCTGNNEEHGTTKNLLILWAPLFCALKMWRTWWKSRHVHIAQKGHSLDLDRQPNSLTFPFAGKGLKNSKISRWKGRNYIRCMIPSNLKLFVPIQTTNTALQHCGPNSTILSLLQVQFSGTTEHYLIFKPAETWRKTDLILKRHVPGPLLLTEASQGPKTFGRVILYTEEMVQHTSRFFLCLSNWVQHLFVQNIWCFEVPSFCICWWNIILFFYASLSNSIEKCWICSNSLLSSA